MKVITRSGNKEDVRFDLITAKIKYLSEDPKFGHQLNIDPVFVAQNIVGLIYDGITTSELDEFTASFSATLFKNDPDYLNLASRITVDNHHKNTSDFFSAVCSRLNGAGILSDEFMEIVLENEMFISDIIDYTRDYSISYFGFKTLQQAYLLKISGEVVERPQHLFMRVAIAIHGRDMNLVKKVYNSLSEKYYTHATPTLFNSGTTNWNGRLRGRTLQDCGGYGANQ